MQALRIVNFVVLIGCLVGGVYYALTDNEVQGALVVLLGILYFLGLPQVIGASK